MKSKNTIIFDESKFEDGSLYCFARLVYRNINIFNKIEKDLQKIKIKYKKRTMNKT